MSTSNDTDDRPDPHDDPETIIREALGPHRDALEAIAEMDMGLLSEDARHALAILDQDDGGDSS